MKRELSIPPDTEGANRAIEVFHGWIVDGKLQCTLTKALLFELSKPTDEHTGDFVGR
jgi:hypothetical protein